MSDASCPNCTKPRVSGGESCPYCGVFYAKWKPRSERPPQGMPAAKPSGMPPLKVLGVLLFAVGVLVGSRQLRPSSKTPEASAPEAPAPSGPEPSAGTREPVAAAAAPSGPPAPGIPAEARALIPILDAVNAELAADGIRAAYDDVKWDFQKTCRAVHPATLRRRGEEAGLPPPERRPFDAEDKRKARGFTAKCVVNGRAVYADNFIARGAGATECWSRLSGNKVISSSWGSNLVQFGANLDAWERYSWQPHNKRWAPYDENGERLVLRYFVSTLYGFGAEQKDREESRKRIEKERVNPDRMELSTKRAVLQAYKSRILRAGAQRRLKDMNGW